MITKHMAADNMANAMKMVTETGAAMPAIRGAVEEVSTGQGGAWLTNGLDSVQRHARAFVEGFCLIPFN